MAMIPQAPQHRKSIARRRDMADDLCHNCRRDIGDAVVPVAERVLDVTFVRMRYDANGTVMMRHADIAALHRVSPQCINNAISRILGRAISQCRKLGHEKGNDHDSR